MKLHAMHLIGGAPRRDAAPEHRAVDPSTGAALEPAFADATQAELDAALDLALAAHRGQALADPDRRARFLERIAAEIEALGDALIERAQLETGLPRPRLVGERGRTCGQLRSFAAIVREGSWVGARLDPAQPERQPVPRPDLRRMLVPLGPVAVFGASNFPLAFSVAGGDTASAFAAGCPVVAKAHPSHPGTSELVGGAIVAAAAACGLAPGVFALVHGASHAVGGDLVRHPKLRAVAFTGSLRGGRALVEIAAARPCPIPVFAEMGSINPVFVLPAALAARGPAIAAAAAASLTLGVGQFCTNPGLLVVPTGPAGDAFVAALAEALAKVEAGVMLDPNILASYRAGLASRSVLSGVERVRNHELGDPEVAPRRAKAALFTTTAAHFMAEPKLHEELFGPAGLVVRVAPEAEALVALIHGLEGQLSASIHGDADDPGDLALAAQLLPALGDRVGRVVWNAFTTGVEVCPAMQHGGPWPASSDARTTSVGGAAIERFARPLCLQDLPPALLPAALHDDNPLGLARLIDSRWAARPAGS